VSADLSYNACRAIALDYIEDALCDTVSGDVKVFAPGGASAADLDNIAEIVRELAADMVEG
jgi:hypothetical protein